MPITLDGTNGITNDGGYTGDGVVFADTTPANTLVTTTGGNVGIGTNAPTAKLVTNGPAQFIGSGAVFPTTGCGVEIVGAPNGSPSYIQAYNRDNSTWQQVDLAGSVVSFRTGGTERARIDSSGNLLVGTTTASGLIATTVGAGKVGYYTNKSSAGGGLDHAQYYTDGSLQGKITQTGGFTTVSDYRLKSDVVPLSGMLEKVCKLKPVSYTLTAFGQQQFGFIAHELQEELAVFVDGAKDAVNEDGSIAPQSVDYSKIVSVLTAAIQEQQAIIDAQQAALTALTARVAALDASLDARLTSLEGTQP